MVMNPKKRAVLDRIKHLEAAIAKGREYLENGTHAHWHGFRPLFAARVVNGERLPPHKDWVKNVFLPRRQKALRQAQKVLGSICDHMRDVSDGDDVTITKTRKRKPS
jgi:hypothetical protein